MDALDYTVTITPIDIVAALSLSAGKAYFGQNISTGATLYGRPESTTPAASARAFRYESGGEFEFTVAAGEKIFMWTDDPLGCQLILNELPA